jgi:hypothetical protein
MKPDAPKEFRGEFNPIKTNVPGIEICEHMPLQAKMFDKLAVIRSIVSVDEHSDSLVMTGWSERDNRIAQHPSFGAVVSKVRGRSSDTACPPFVSLRGMTRGTEPGFLGVAHRPFTPSGPGLNNLRLNRDISLERLENRKVLLAKLDQTRRDLDASGTMEGLDSFTARAFEIVTSGAMRNALDLSKEDPRVRDRYGKATQFLLARRLVEAGVGLVTLAIGGWDTHDNNFRQLRNQLPDVDRAVATLVEDLHQRGLDRDVLVVMWGEFGRTPRINGQAGRDHWPQVMSCLVAGGGLRTGQAIGASSSRGEYPKDRPCHIQNILATFYHALGIDPAMTFTNNSGRPMHLLDEREVIGELL